MRLLLKLCALVATITLLDRPAFASTPYVGIEAGPAFARSNDVDENVSYHPLFSPSETVFYDDVLSTQYSHASDVGILAGYHLGWFRFELELGQKRLRLSRTVQDDITDKFVTDLNVRLNAASAFGPPELGRLTIADFQPSDTLKVRSAMLNGMFEKRLTGRLTLFGGGGLGRSFASGFGGTDQALAWQYSLGARLGLGRRTAVHLKYRYFNSGILKLVNDPRAFHGTMAAGSEAPSSATVTSNIEGKIRTRSVLLGITFELR